MEPSVTNGSTDKEVMEVKKKNPIPKFAELEGTAMTLSGEEESLINEATQNLLEFAVTKGHTIHSVTHMTRIQLADFLRDFYGKVKAKNDDSLTLKDVRVGLHKFFLDEVSIDILRDRTFELANATFDLALRANPRKCNRMRIEMEDMKKIYLSDAMDTNKPDTLQNKVFFDISLYICNKGKDYFRGMKKNDFDVSTDIQGRRYVWLKDTTLAPARDGDGYSTKQKRGLEDDPPAYQVGERMYERPGDPRCPLSSFLKYVTHLHPMTDAFWQRPKRNVSQSDYVWYDHAPLGSSTLTKIMQRISLQAGLSDNYTNYSIRSACIPLVEEVCEQALRLEGGGQLVANPAPTVDIIKRSHVASEDMSSDDSLSQTSELQAAKELDSGVGLTPKRERPPAIGASRSMGSSGSTDVEDTDVCGLMQAKTQVLDLIRGLMVKDIQKFVDWLKTVRVQYSSGELIVLCSPVDKSHVEPIPEDITIDRNGIPSRTSTPDPTLKKSGSFDLPDKHHRLKRELSQKSEGQDKPDLSEVAGMTIKQVDFNSLAGVNCSSDEFGPMKITIPAADTLLVTGVPENLQLMLHKKRGGPGQKKEPLADRVFCSENEMDVAEVVAIMGTAREKSKQRNNNYQPPGLQQPVVVVEREHLQPRPHMMVVQQKVQQSPMMLTIPAAHSTGGHSTPSARDRMDQFKDYRNRSVGCLDSAPPIADGALKRVSSTGTPVLKRQAHVMDSGNMFPENLSTKRLRDDTQATNLSTKASPDKKVESRDAKKAHADRLADSLRYHQEILQNSPLIKRPGERNFSGFRHCYANTVGNTVKSEPLDTSYS